MPDDIDNNIYISRSASEEIAQALLRRNETRELHKFSSFKGHAICILHLVRHAVGIALKPLMYLAFTVVFLAGLVFNRRDPDIRREAYTTIKCCISATLAAPLGQIILACKAFVGIFHPGAYYAYKLSDIEHINQYIENRGLRNATYEQANKELVILRSIPIDRLYGRQRSQMIELHRTLELIDIADRQYNNDLAPNLDPHDQNVITAYAQDRARYHGDLHQLRELIAYIENLPLDLNRVARLANYRSRETVLVSMANDITNRMVGIQNGAMWRINGVNRVNRFNAALPVDPEIQGYFDILVSFAQAANCNAALMDALREGERTITQKLADYQDNEKQHFLFIYGRALKFMCEKLPNSPDKVNALLSKLASAASGPASGLDACAPGLARLFESIRLNMDEPEDPEKVLTWLHQQYKLDLIEGMCTECPAALRGLLTRLGGGHETNQANGLILLFGREIGLPQSIIDGARDRNAHPERISPEDKKRLLEAFHRLYTREGLEAYMQGRINGDLDASAGLAAFRLNVMNKLTEEYEKDVYAGDIEDAEDDIVKEFDVDELFADSASFFVQLKFFEKKRRQKHCAQSGRL